MGGVLNQAFYGDNGDTTDNGMWIGDFSTKYGDDSDLEWLVLYEGCDLGIVMYATFLETKRRDVIMGWMPEIAAMPMAKADDACCIAKTTKNLRQDSWNWQEEEVGTGCTE